MTILKRVSILQLRNVLNKVAVATNPQGSHRYPGDAVQVVIGDGKLIARGTDGRRLHRAEITCDWFKGESKTFLLRGACVRHILASNASAQVDFTATDVQWRVKKTWSYPVAEGCFPKNADQLIADASRKTPQATMNGKACAIAPLFAPFDGVNIYINGHCNVSDPRHAVERIKWTGRTTTRVNPEFMHDALSVCDDAPVEIRFTDEPLIHVQALANANSRFDAIICPLVIPS